MVINVLELLNVQKLILMGDVKLDMMDNVYNLHHLLIQLNKKHVNYLFNVPMLII